MFVRGRWGYGWSIKPLAEALDVNMVCPSKETDGSFKVMLVLVRRQETREIARSIQGGSSRKYIPISDQSRKSRVVVRFLSTKGE